MDQFSVNKNLSHNMEAGICDYNINSVCPFDRAITCMILFVIIFAHQICCESSV